MQHPGLIWVVGGVLTSSQWIRTVRRYSNCRTFNYLLLQSYLLVTLCSMFLQKCFSVIVTNPSLMLDLPKVQPCWRYTSGILFFFYFRMMYIHTHTGVPVYSEKSISLYSPIRNKYRINRTSGIRTFQVSSETISRNVAVT